MVDYNPKRDKNITFFYVLLALVVIVIITLIVLTATDAFEKRKTGLTGRFDEDYFNINDPWGETKNQPIDSQVLAQVNTIADPTGTCNWYIYENLYDEPVKPRLRTLFTDYLNSLCHVDVPPPDKCISADQLFAVNSIHTCKELSAARCITVTGNLMPKGQSEIFTRSCLTSSFPDCVGTLGSLSFNFKQDSRTGLVNSKIKVIEINRIFVSPNTFDKIDKEIPFYTQEANLFIKDPRITDDDVFEPVIINTRFKEGNFKQRLKINRYGVSKGAFFQIANGPYAGIIFRPYNLYLDIEEINNSGQIYTLKFENNIRGGIDNDKYTYLDPLKRRKVIRKSSSENDIDAYCFLTIGQIDPDTYQIFNLTFSLRGAGFKKDEEIKIEPDQEGDYDFDDAILKATVDETTSNNTIITLKKYKDIKGTIVWLLMPPLDLEKKVWPQKQRGNYMNGISVNSDVNFYQDLSRPSTGRKKNEKPENTKLYQTECQTHHSNIQTWGLINPVSKVSKGTYVLQTNLNINGEDRREDLDSYYPPAAWLQKIPVKCNFKEDESEPISFILDLNKTPDFIFKAINQTPGFVSENEDFFWGIVGYRKGYDGSGGQEGYRNYILPFTQSQYVNFQSKSTINVPVPIGIVSGRVFKYGDKIVDNQVVWLIINPYELVTTFLPSYFIDSFDTGSSVTEILPRGEGDPIYRDTTGGEIDEISFDNSNYNGGGVVGNYSINLDIESDIVSGIEEGSGASIYMVIGIDEESKTREIMSIIVIERGILYKDGAAFDVNLGEIEIKNLKITTFEPVFEYRAVAEDSNGNYIPSPVVNDRITVDGFSLNPESIEINDGKLVISPDDDINDAILLGGYGYNEGDILYINQIDSFGIQTVNDSQSVEKLFSLSVKTIANLSYSATSLAPSNLLAPGVKLQKDGLLDPDRINDDDFATSFYIGTPKMWDKSPPQIAYVKEILNELKPIIKTNNPAEFEEYFGQKENDNSIDTKINYIKTLQFRDLNYRKIRRKTIDIDPNTLYNDISLNEELILGRFIPTSETNKEETEIRVEDDEEEIVKTGFTFTLYTSNYSQFIPYGIGKIYNKFITPSELPTF